MSAPRCEATVYTRDDYRYTGGGSSGFTMHYCKGQCTRAALPGSGLCWQHDPERIAERDARLHERRFARQRRATLRRLRLQHERRQRQIP